MYVHTHTHTQTYICKKKLAWPSVAECSRDKWGQQLPSTPGGLQQDPAGPDAARSICTALQPLQWLRAQHPCCLPLCASPPGQRKHFPFLWEMVTSGPRGRKAARCRRNWLAKGPQLVTSKLWEEQQELMQIYWRYNTNLLVVQRHPAEEGHSQKKARR